jgi:hypothetical protein
MLRSLDSMAGGKSVISGRIRLPDIADPAQVCQARRVDVAVESMRKRVCWFSVFSVQGRGVEEIAGRIGIAS